MHPVFDAASLSSTNACMPYLTRQQREKLEWIPLKEAVRYVSEIEGAPSAEGEPPAQSVKWPWAWMPPPDPTTAAERWALHQIRLALRDGEIPVRWAQLKWPDTKTFVPDTLFSPEPPPECGPFWTHVFIYPSREYAVAEEAVVLSGGIFSDYLDKEPLRQLWLFKARVCELWPTRPAPSDKGERPSTEEYRQRAYQAAKKIYEQGQPNLDQAWIKLRRLVPGIPRKIGRDEVLNMEEFAQRRRRPGNNRSRKEKP